jgi:ubiquitin C-terminal hydrolase
MKIVSFSNLGNTCYINSVLQCFIYNPCFQKYHNLQELEKVIEQIDLTKNDQQAHLTCNIPGFIQMIFDKKKAFKRFQQNDAHEFLIEFLDLLITNTDPEQFCTLGTLENPSLISWNNFLKQNKYSKFVKEYHGQTKLTITCSCCQTSKEVFEEFNTINLNVENDAPDITSLFVKYLKRETNSDTSNLYFCENCRSEQISDQKISLSILPNILIVVLKRYTQTSKVNRELKYEDKLFIKDNHSIKTYNLQSIIHHIGGLYDGHYSASVKLNGSWYHIDDNSVSVNLTRENAYILFYNKV